MKQARYERWGEPCDVIHIVDVPARSPASGEVVVAIEAAPVHLADLYGMRGAVSFRKPLPATPGFEGIGRIVRAAPDVRELAVGDRVFVHAGGTWQQEIVLPAAGLIRAPQGDAVQLALMAINPPTSYLILKDFGDLKPGDWIIQNAANSNCGRYLIALARRWGLRTVNVVRREDVIADLQALGGDIVVVDGPDLAARVAAATGGAPIRLAVDAVNGLASARLVACLGDGGTLLVYGMAAGEMCIIPPDALFVRDIRVQGFYTRRQMALRTPLQRQAIFDDLCALFAAGALAAKIAAVYPLDRVADAVRHAGRKGADRDGKIILLPRG